MMWCPLQFLFNLCYNAVVSLVVCIKELMEPYEVFQNGSVFKRIAFYSFAYLLV